MKEIQSEPKISHFTRNRNAPRCVNMKPYRQSRKSQKTNFVRQPRFNQRPPIRAFRSISPEIQKMPYLRLKVGPDIGEKDTHVKVGFTTDILLDSGTAVTCMSYDFYSDLVVKFNGGYHLYHHFEGYITPSDGKKMPVFGLTRINFSTENGTAFQVPTLIVKGLNEDLILGYDFFQGPLYHHLEKYHIVLSVHHEADTRIKLIKKCYGMDQTRRPKWTPKNPRLSGLKPSSNMRCLTSRQSGPNMNQHGFNRNLDNQPLRETSKYESRNRFEPLRRLNKDHEARPGYRDLRSSSKNYKHTKKKPYKPRKQEPKWHKFNEQINKRNPDKDYMNFHRHTEPDRNIRKPCIVCHSDIRHNAKVHQTVKLQRAQGYFRRPNRETHPFYVYRRDTYGRRISCKLIIPDHYERRDIVLCSQHRHLGEHQYNNNMRQHTRPHYSDPPDRQSHRRQPPDEPRRYSNEPSRRQGSDEPRYYDDQPRNMHNRQDDNYQKNGQAYRQNSIQIKDRYLNDQEKDIELNHYNDEGYYKNSVTSYIEEKGSVTEVYLSEDSETPTKTPIDQFDLRHIEPEIKRHLLEILTKHVNMFSKHKWDIGKTKYTSLEIELNDNTPKMQKYTPLPIGIRENVKSILAQLLKYDIIRVCHETSPYCSNLMVTDKNEKGTTGILFDGRLLNYDTKQIPIASTLDSTKLFELYSRKYVSIFDLSDMFFQIPLDEKSQILTSFYGDTHGMRYCFTRCPESLLNSNIYLKTLINSLFSDLSNEILYIGNDLIVSTDNTSRDHLSIIDIVLYRLKDANLKIRPQKVHLFKENFEFLGTTFNKKSQKLKDASVLPIRNIPSPQTPTKLKAMIGLLSSFKHEIDNFTEKIDPLIKLSEVHQMTYKWTDNHETILRSMVNTICEKALSYKPNPAKTFHVTTDASSYCAGGRIYQKDENGSEKVIASVARPFTKTERNYSIFKKEILALLYTMKACDYYLRFAKKITINVDAKSILYLRLVKESSGILQRFSLELSKYKTDIFHIAGEENIVSDVLSRQHTDIEDLKVEDEINATMPELEATILVDSLDKDVLHTLNGMSIQQLLGGNSPKMLSSKKPQKSKAISGKRVLKNAPETLGNKKVNLPRMSKNRPGKLLPPPKCHNIQLKDTFVSIDDIVLGDNPFDPIKT